MGIYLLHRLYIVHCVQENSSNGFSVRPNRWEFRSPGPVYCHNALSLQLEFPREINPQSIHLNLFKHNWVVTTEDNTYGILWFSQSNSFLVQFYNYFPEDKKSDRFSLSEISNILWTSFFFRLLRSEYARPFINILSHNEGIAATVVLSENWGT